MLLLQVQATFAGGLSEHLQAAGGANASVTASLRDSLAQMAAISDKLAQDVAQGQRRLVDAAMDVRTGPTSAISQLSSFLSRLIMMFLPATASARMSQILLPKRNCSCRHGPCRQRGLPPRTRKPEGGAGPTHPSRTVPSPLIFSSIYDWGGML